MSAARRFPTEPRSAACAPCRCPPTAGFDMPARFGEHGFRSRHGAPYLRRAHRSAPVRADSGCLTCPAFPVCPPSGLADSGVAPALQALSPAASATSSAGATFASLSLDALLSDLAARLAGSQELHLPSGTTHFRPAALRPRPLWSRVGDEGQHHRVSRRPTMMHLLPPCTSTVARPASGVKT